MITNPDDVTTLGSSPSESSAVNNNNEYEPIKTEGDASATSLLLNPFDNTQHRFDDAEFDMPSIPPEHHQHQHQQHQQYYQHQGYQQQQHYQQWPQQQQQYHHQQQPQQQHQMYPPQTHMDQHHHYQQQQQQQHYYGNMYSHAGPMYNGNGQQQQAGPQNATPSPTTNSDDSGGDCVTESKRMMAAQTVHPQEVHTAHAAAQAHHGYYPGRGVPLVQKRPRQARRSKKKRDPNEPQKPVSAYALFFRDMQAGIKQRNPNASFGEVSKHVASMWDNLNPDHKAAYKKRTENAKKEYLKQLAAYRANLVSKSHNDPYSPYSGIASYYKTSTTSSYEGIYGRPLGPTGVSAPSPGGTMGSSPTGASVQDRAYAMHNNTSSTPPTSSHSPHGHGGVHPAAAAASAVEVGAISPASSASSSTAAAANGASSNGGLLTTVGPGSAGAGGVMLTTAGNGASCRRPGCGNTVLDFAMNGFCSNDCVLSQSREIYHSWSHGGAANGAAAGGAAASTPTAATAACR